MRTGACEFGMQPYAPAALALWPGVRAEAILVGPAQPCRTSNPYKALAELHTQPVDWQAKIENFVDPLQRGRTTCWVVLCLTRDPSCCQALHRLGRGLSGKETTAQCSG